jgi:hypothetical protein
MDSNGAQREPFDRDQRLEPYRSSTFWSRISGIVAVRYPSWRTIRTRIRRIANRGPSSQLNPSATSKNDGHKIIVLAHGNGVHSNRPLRRDSLPRPIGSVAHSFAAEQGKSATENDKCNEPDGRILEYFLWIRARLMDARVAKCNGDQLLFESCDEPYETPRLLPLSNSSVPRYLMVQSSPRRAPDD